MKRTVFTTSIQFLIISLLLLAVLVPREVSQKAMVIVAGLWILFTLVHFIYRHFRNPIKTSDTDKSSKTIRKEKTLKLHKLSFKLPKEKPAQTATAPTEDIDSKKMLVHIALRISDKLKSAYPDAVWQWTETPSLHDILAGRTFRICVENMSSYNHADVCFDRYGRIHVEPMTIGTFIPEDGTASAEEKPTEPAPVDVRVWYDLIGQKILGKHITELNAKGHGKLTIKENGDIIINRQKKEVLVATLDSFPAKQYWNELVTVLEENELCAKANDKNLIVSWVG